MTKLEAEILANGCGDLAALQWCRERRATVRFWSDGSVSVRPERTAREDHGESLPGAVLNWVRTESGVRP